MVMSTIAAEQLDHKAEELLGLAQHFIRASIERDFIAMALDVTAITAAITELQRIAAAVTAGESAASAAAAAAQEESDQATLNSATGNLTTALAAVSAEFPATPVTGNLTVTPASVSLTAGVAGTVPLTISGGVAPYTASGLPGGVTFNGSALVEDGTQTAGTDTVTISDSTTPTPETATVMVTIT